jgi:hypothetical protein
MVMGWMLAALVANAATACAQTSGVTNGLYLARIAAAACHQTPGAYTADLIARQSGQK